MTNRNEVTNHEQEALIAAKDALRRFERGDSSQDEDALRNLIDRFEIVVSERDSLRLAWEDAEAHVAALLRTPTPTDDERLDIISAASAAFKARGGAPDWEEDAIARDLIIRWHLRGFEDGLAAGFQRSVVPEPSTYGQDDWDNRDDEVDGETRGFLSCGRCTWSMERGLFADLHEHQRTHESEPQGEPSDWRINGLVERAQSIVDQMKTSSGDRRGDEWCYVRFGHVSALEEVLRVIGRAAPRDAIVEAGADELWRRLTRVGTKPGPTMAECQEIIRAALRAAGVGGAR